ncbi:MAG: hypothetical protein QOE15_2942 [Acidimicrobiaceae bacterium]|nr:hypothetical protein [Acidimicrobiaceae bacterium]
MRVIPVLAGQKYALTSYFAVEARRIELPNLLHAMQALYQLSYAPAGCGQPSKGESSFGGTWRPNPIRVHQQRA